MFYKFSAAFLKLITFAPRKINALKICQVNTKLKLTRS